MCQVLCVFPFLSAQRKQQAWQRAEIVSECKKVESRVWPKRVAVFDVSYPVVPDMEKFAAVTSLPISQLIDVFLILLGSSCSHTKHNTFTGPTPKVRSSCVQSQPRHRRYFLNLLWVYFVPRKVKEPCF